MDFIIDAIVEWLKGLLVDGIMGNLEGLFTNVNTSVGEIATQVGTTPADWNAGVFSMITADFRNRYFADCRGHLTFVNDL